MNSLLVAHSNCFLGRILDECKATWEERLAKIYRVELKQTVESSRINHTKHGGTKLNPYAGLVQDGLEMNPNSTNSKGSGKIMNVSIELVSVLADGEIGKIDNLQSCTLHALLSKDVQV